MQYTTEQWSPIAERPCYLISSEGRVMNSKTGNLLSGAIGANGYRSVGLSAGLFKTVAVHRLVALAFVSGYRTGLCVNHKDGDKLNNRADNLEWISLGDNTRHAIEIGICSQTGEHNGCARLTADNVTDIRARLTAGESSKSLAKLYAVHATTISKIKHHKSWRES